jgi:hypothetical protein
MLSCYLQIEGDQVMNATKIFSGKVKVRRDLISYGPVNGYQIKDVVTLNTDQTIYGKYHKKKNIYRPLPPTYILLIFYNIICLTSRSKDIP